MVFIDFDMGLMDVSMVFSDCFHVFPHLPGEGLKILIKVQLLFLLLLLLLLLLVYSFASSS